MTTQSILAGKCDANVCHQKLQISSTRYHSNHNWALNVSQHLVSVLYLQTLLLD